MTWRKIESIKECLLEHHGKNPMVLLDETVSKFV